MSPLSIGLVGFGRWGRLIHRDLKSLGAVVHVATPSAESRQAALAAGAASVCGDVAELPELDGYVAAPPTVLHAQVVETLLPRGRPIFVEKPLTDDLAAARRIAQAGAGRVFVMDKWRYHPGIVELGRLARSGELGAIRAVRSYRLGWGNPHADVDATWILLPHDLSILLEILGRIPEPVSAASSIPGAAGEDLTAVLQDGADGVRAVLEVSTLHAAARRAVVVVGDSATAQLADSYDDRVLVADGGIGTNARPREIPVASGMPLLLELQAFLGHLEGGPPPRSSVAEGLVVVDRVTALRRLAGLP